MFGEQLTQVEDSDDPMLITLTVGGNDLLSAFGNRPKRALLEKIERDVAEAYDFLVDHAAGTLSEWNVDRQHDLRSVGPVRKDSRRLDEIGPLPLEILDRMNDHIRALAIGTPRVLLADVHAHFLGHGVSVGDDDRWYWRRSLVEPNARGANEIRRLWLDVVDSDEATR